MELKSIKNAFTQVVENQRLCSSKAQEVIDKIGLEIEGAITEIKSKHTLNLSDAKFMLNELHGKLVELMSVEKLEESWKQLDAGMSRYAVTDISKAYRNNNDYDFKIINQIVARHFYQQCLFDLGDLFADEANLVPDDEDLTRDLYETMHRMLESMRPGDLKEALMQQYCNVVGQSRKGYLRVSVAAGFNYLPHLLKVADDMAPKKQEWEAMKQCPEAFDLEKEFMFHSSFMWSLLKRSDA